MPPSTPSWLPVLAAAFSILCAAAGVGWAARVESARLLIPFSGGMLLGTAIFGVFPESVSELGWITGTILFVTGFGLLSLAGRFVVEICPSCSHRHSHDGCAEELHGYAAPLAATAAVHAFLDGWSLQTATSSSLPGVRIAVTAAILLHKLPEGLALGMMMRAATRTRRSAVTWSAMAEFTTVLGGIFAFGLSADLGSRWAAFPLGIAGGLFVFLGGHAVHGDAKLRGAAHALSVALGGVLLTAGMQWGASRFFG